MPTRTFAALAALALIAAAPARADDAADALKDLEGTWQAVRIINDGQEGDAESVKNQRLIIKGDTFTLDQPEANIRGTLKLDPSKEPSHMDATYRDPDGGSGTAQCIYKLEGEKLTICWSDAGGRRPSEFSAEAGTARRLMVLERQKDDSR